MLSVINNTTMRHVATVPDMDLARAWAETVPWMNDFSIVAHNEEDLRAYSLRELNELNQQLAPASVPPRELTRDVAVKMAVTLLNEHQITSAPPPDAKRVAPLPSYEENEMATRKKATTKKPAARKAPAKAPAKKKVAAKKAATPKVERVRQNGVLLPKKGSKAGQCWVIADKLAKKAGAPPKRSDVVEACVKAGLNKAGSSADFQAWRKFHGLVKAQS